LLLISTRLSPLSISFFFFFPDPPTTEIYPLSLHDALPISPPALHAVADHDVGARLNALALPQHCQGRIDKRPRPRERGDPCGRRDRKSTRLNSSHVAISYAVFCLKKKKCEENIALRDNIHR